MKKIAALRTILLILAKMTACCAVFFLSAKCASGEQRKTEREAVEVIRVSNTERSIGTEIKGTVQAPGITDLTFSVGGKLEAGETDLTSGTRFKKGKLLAQIDNRTAYDGFNRRKMALAAQLIGMMPEIRSRFPGEETKWSRFILGLKPENLVPELPAFGSPAERDLITEKEIPKTHRALLQEQDGMKRYFFLAPFDGYVAEVKKQPGSTIRSGTPVARLAKAGPWELHLQVPLEVLRDSNEPLMSTTDFPVKATDGTVIGKRGKQLTSQQLYRKTPSMIEQVYVFEPSDRKKLRHNTPVTISTSYRTTDDCSVLPATAVSGDRVQLVHKGKLVTRQITIVGKEGDSVYVTGLKDEDAVVVSFRRKTDPNTYYFPK